MDRILKMNLQYSYVAVLLKAFFSSCNDNGKADLHDVVRRYGDYYRERINAGNVSEKDDSIFSKRGFTDSDIRRNVLLNPLRRSFLANYLSYNKENDTIEMNGILWKMLSVRDKKVIIEICDNRLKDYYDKISIT